MKALDLFCGAGGLASGFSNAGFDVTGVDTMMHAGETFELNKLGRFIRTDLRNKVVPKDGYDIILGGPPCKPWATVNVVRRGSDHRDYNLLSRYFKHVQLHRPSAFLFENVSVVGNSSLLRKNVNRMKNTGYSIASQLVKYSDYGAPTRRRRLILFGIKGSEAARFFEELSKYKKDPKNVKDVIWHLRDKKKGSIYDHDWPELKTIDKYRSYYETSKFGWYILNWKEPAPSFGNIMKTYILHPDSFDGGITRVISVKEALLVMGFQKQFQFPMTAGLGARYQMIADSVSPEFSSLAGKVALKMLDNAG